MTLTVGQRPPPLLLSILTIASSQLLQNHCLDCGHHSSPQAHMAVLSQLWHLVWKEHASLPPRKADHI